MSVSGVVSSPVLQWLQSYHSKSGPATGSQSCYGCQSSSDTTSISHIHNPKDLTRSFFSPSGRPWQRWIKRERMWNALISRQTRVTLPPI
jgi:hypothetical protein